MKLQLCCGDAIVGEILDPFVSDDAGHGLFRQHLRAGRDPDENRIHEFIAFCEAWHARLKAGADPEPSEFDTYRDVWDSGTWRTITPDGSIDRIDAPVFVEGEVTWRIA